MKVVGTIAEVREYVGAAKRRGESVGFVPTMGYLHDGHLALIRRARAENDVVVVSIFVNPLQFGPNEDYERYPRDLERDIALAETGGADLVFAPSVSEMYPRPMLTYVNVEKLSEGMCGASRPGHFRGVATVVCKLFNIVTPDRAYFGQKDAQQAAVIKRMVGDLNINVQTVTVGTVREPDGLAMSSRNVYLDAGQRSAALVLSKSLSLARRMIEAGERDAGKVRDAMTRMIQSEPLARLDYIALVDAEDLVPLDRLSGPVLIALAVFIGNTRLIDNILVEVGGCPPTASP
ncbi:MAG: pantoate--beta-alanine ligase [Firmicutes bacterium]|jgi:pantoate--beta-alanine ligase|nr:pantoate--beta-alanine ligase [Bacillota bacterium]